MKLLFRILYSTAAMWLGAASAADAITPAVVKASVANLRAQPSASSEVLTRLKMGEAVTVVTQIPDATKPSGPPRWAKIQLPHTVSVWIAASLIDQSTMSVNSTVANLRAGPGRNYNQVGQLAKGTKIGPITTSDGWMEIEGPSGAFGYVATELLDFSARTNSVTKSAPAPIRPIPPTASQTTLASTPTSRSVPLPSQMPRAPAATQPQPALSVPASVPPGATLASEPAPIPAVRASSAQANPVPVAPTPIGERPAAVVPPQTVSETSPSETRPNPPTAVATPVPTRPTPIPAAPSAGVERRIESVTTDYQPVTRIVTREGVVNYTLSIQAPTVYELLSPRRGEFGVVNFILTSDPALDLKKYYGKRVYATGEEWVDERWPRTPILRIQNIELVW